MNLLRYGPKLDKEMLFWIKVVVLNYRNNREPRMWLSTVIVETMEPVDLYQCLFWDEEEVKKALDNSINILATTYDNQLYKILHGRSRE